MVSRYIERIKTPITASIKIGGSSFNNRENFLFCAPCQVKCFEICIFAKHKPLTIIPNLQTINKISNNE